MSAVVQVDQAAPAPGAVKQVADVLRRGGVALIPTDTVYGVAVAVLPGSRPEALYRIKHRDADKAIPWLIPDASALAVYAERVPGFAHRLAAAYWPGALTLILPATPAVPPAFCADDGTVALRVPGSGFVRALAREVGAPLLTSSANLQGEPAPAAFAEVSPAISEAVDIAVDGGCTARAAASTIVSCVDERPVVVRESAIDADLIMEVCLDD